MALAHRQEPDIPPIIIVQFFKKLREFEAAFDRCKALVDDLDEYRIVGTSLVDEWNECADSFTHEGSAYQELEQYYIQADGGY